MRKLNLGCGDEYKVGWINVDHRDNIKKDVKHDLNKFPYPFKKGYIDFCFMKGTITFLKDPIKVLKEMARITKKNGKIVVITPHAISYAHLSGVGHETNFTENSFDGSKLKEFQLEKDLKLNSCDFVFHHTWKRYIPFKKYLKIFLHGIYDDIKFEFEVLR
jgi:SAM-dependent methyltransferase